MKIKVLSILVVTTIALASCNDDIDTAGTNNDGSVKFASGVSIVKSRVSGSDGDIWDNGDAIGIYMVDHGETTIREGVNNVKYTTTSATSTATFLPDDPAKAIYYPVDATQKVDFIAYYPQTSSVQDYTYNIDVTDQEKQSDLDLMRAFNNNEGAGYDKTNKGNYINILFKHKLTKIIITTTPDVGLEQTDLNNMTVTIRGLNAKATYRIETDELDEASPADNAPIITKSVIAGKQYEAIVVPQAFNAGTVTIEFALNNTKNEVFVYKVPAKEFKAADKHIFKVKVQRTGVSVNGEIEKWATVGLLPEEGTAT